MHCVNVRQLKNNPSEALREAVEGPVLVLKGDLPEAVLLHLETGDSAEDMDLRLALAVALFKSEALSLGRGARIAGLPVDDFVRHLSRLGVSVVEGDEEQARSDLETLEGWLA
ncbi:MAG: UPF0175 family protein [Acidobacteriota bacterium]|nr:UPF0175 family protein [Acidobacteriota bacterium]